jgi:hypothetical protein
MKVLRTLLAAGFVLLAVSTVAAQTGGLRVTVYDAADKTPLPGVTVVLKNSQQLVATTTVITNKNGVADFPVLRAGSGFSLDVSFPGYAKQQMANIRVPINQVQSVSFILAPETIEKVVVEAKRETVDLEKTSTSTKFGEDFIQDLPVQGRFYQNVLTMTAGVQDADGDGNPNVHGARSTDFKAEVGGVSNQDPLTGLQMSQVNPDSIEEIEVITAGAGVEFGRAQGGFANIIQKQGSNDFEGTFNFLFKSSLLDGGAASFPGSPVPKYQHLEPAVQVSGPIVKDKLWYRLSHEYIKQEDPVVTSGGDVNVTTKRQINSDAITWQVSPRNKLQLTYSADPLTVTNWGVSRLTPVASSVRRELGGPLYRLGWTAPFSAKILVDSFVSYQDKHTNILPSTTGVPNNCVQAIGSLSAISNAMCTNLETGQTSGSSYLTWRDKSQRFTLRSTANIFGGHFLGMDHQFKVGVSVENERYYRSETRLPDVYFYIYRPMNNNQSASGDINPIAVVQGRFGVPVNSTSRSTDTASAVFLEDMIKPRQNLSITIGLRIDRQALNSDGYQPFDPAAEEERYYNLREAIAKSYAADQVRLNPAQDYAFYLQSAYGLSETNNTVPNPAANFLPARYEAFTALADVTSFERALSDQLGGMDVGSITGTAITNSKNWYQKRRAGGIDITNTDFGAHLAASWDPWSNGKTKLAFSARRLYGTTPLIVPLSEIEPSVVSLRFQAKQTGGGVWQARLANGLNPSASIQVVDRNLRTPYNDELTFSFEREIFAETTAKLTYIYRRFVDQFQDTDLNHYPADYGKCRVQTAPENKHSWIQLAFDEHGRPVPDGKMDDCDGQLTAPPPNANGGGGEEGGGGTNTKLDLSQFLHSPDGYLDTYTHNVGWGSIYMTGNFNFATYKGLQLEVIRRQYRNWQMNASYTWARALGNGESWNSFLGDDRTTRDAEFGYLSYDVRHSLKVNATTITPWGFRAGTAVTWESGLPYSILQQKPTADSAPPTMIDLGDPEPRARLRYITGRRNDQRNRPYWNFDVKLDKEMNLGKGMNLQVAMDIFNLLNDRTYQIWNPFSELGDQLNGYNDGYTRMGRNYQLSMKLSF